MLDLLFCEFLKGAHQRRHLLLEAHQLDLAESFTEETMADIPFCFGVIKNCESGSRSLFDLKVIEVRELFKCIGQFVLQDGDGVVPDCSTEQCCAAISGPGSSIFSVDVFYALEVFPPPA